MVNQRNDSQIQEQKVRRFRVQRYEEILNCAKKIAKNNEKLRKVAGKFAHVKKKQYLCSRF